MKPIALHEVRSYPQNPSSAPDAELCVTACILPPTARHWLLPKPTLIRQRIIRVKHPALSFDKGVRVDLTA
jgi:hypothetical protein